MNRPGCPLGGPRCPESICDCFIETHPDDPTGLHPEMFVVGPDQPHLPARPTRHDERRELMRTESGRVARMPYAARSTCANGHPWTPQTTRWRIRHDKGETSPTRDCLVCKHVSEGKRRRRAITERTYL